MMYDNDCRNNRYYSYFKIFSIAIYCIVIVLWMILMSANLGDDGVVFLTNDTVLERTINAFNGWTSRLIITFISIVFQKKHSLIFLWKIITGLMLISIPIILDRIEIEKKQIDSLKLPFMITLFLMYPFYDMSTAGWITTTVNYVWPGWCMLYAVYLVHRINNSSKTINVAELVLGIIAVMIGTNQEQVSAILMIVFVYSIISSIILKKKIHWYILIGAIISVIEFLWAALSPGNASRFSVEIEHWFPRFDSLSVIEKTIISILNVMRVFVCSFNFVYISFSFILVLFTIYSTKKIIIRIISVLPLLIGLLYSIANLTYTTEWIDKLFMPLEGFYTIDVRSFSVWISVIYFFIIILSMLISLFVIYKNDWYRLIEVVVIIGGGLASALVIGYTPLIYASGVRVFLFFYLTIFLTITLMAEKVVDDNFVKANYGIITMGFVIGAGMVAFNIINVTYYAFFLGR